MPAMHIQEGEPILRKSEGEESRRRGQGVTHPLNPLRSNNGNGGAGLKSGGGGNNTGSNLENFGTITNKNSKVDAPWANKSLTDSQRLKRAAKATIKAAEVSLYKIVGSLIGFIDEGLLPKPNVDKTTLHNSPILLY